MVPITGDYAFKAQAEDLTSEVVSKVYNTSAFEEETTIIVGANKILVALNGTSRVDTHISDTQTGLSSGIPQYLSDLPGQISPTAGTNSVSAGTPISTTTIIIR